MTSFTFFLYPDWSGGYNLRDPGTQPFWMLPPLLPPKPKPRPNPPDRYTRFLRPEAYSPVERRHQLSIYGMTYNQLNYHLAACYHAGFYSLGPRYRDAQELFDLISSGEKSKQYLHDLAQHPLSTSSGQQQLLIDKKTASVIRSIHRIRPSLLFPDFDDRILWTPSPFCEPAFPHPGYKIWTVQDYLDLLPDSVSVPKKIPTTTEYLDSTDFWDPLIGY